MGFSRQLVLTLGDPTRWGSKLRFSTLKDLDAGDSELKKELKTEKNSKRGQATLSLVVCGMPTGAPKKQNGDRLPFH